jgi:Cu/Ag efflux protein CusF
MDVSRARTQLAAALLALAFAIVACSEGPSARTGKAAGRIVAIDTAQSQVTLDHEEIPGLMGAMTMTFPVSDARILEGLAPGQAVEFDVQYAGGVYTVTRIAPR